MGAGNDNVLRLLDLNNSSSHKTNKKGNKDKNVKIEIKDVMVILEIKEHTDEITDCKEILNPLCIATCSKDMTIVFYDINMEKARYTVKGAHFRPIMHLRY